MAGGGHLARAVPQPVVLSDDDDRLRPLPLRRLRHKTRKILRRLHARTRRSAQALRLRSAHLLEVAKRRHRRRRARRARPARRAVARRAAATRRGRRGARARRRATSRGVAPPLLLLLLLPPPLLPMSAMSRSDLRLPSPSMSHPIWTPKMLIDAAPHGALRRSPLGLGVQRHVRPRRRRAPSPARAPSRARAATPAPRRRSARCRSSCSSFAFRPLARHALLSGLARRLRRGHRRDLLCRASISSTCRSSSLDMRARAAYAAFRSRARFAAVRAAAIDQSYPASAGSARASGSERTRMLPAGAGTPRARSSSHLSGCTFSAAILYAFAAPTRWRAVARVQDLKVVFALRMDATGFAGANPRRRPWSAVAADLARGWGWAASSVGRARMGRRLWSEREWRERRERGRGSERPRFLDPHHRKLRVSYDT